MMPIIANFQSCMPTNLAILLPVYNDEASLRKILADISRELARQPGLKVFIINDGSPNDAWTLPSCPFPVEIIHLARNLGHQKAIAIGLSHLHNIASPRQVIVMDCDGEDRVEDIPALVNKQQASSGQVIFASRRKRSNGAVFMAWYQLYKAGFRILTGKSISFGNFACLPRESLDKLVYYPELWSHFPGTVIRSGLPYSSIPIDRGQRYAGESKMNFSSLVLHGFGAIAVFIDKVITRLAIGSFLLMAISLLALLSIVAIRTATDWAIPGWASTLGSSMLIIMLIGFSISLMSVFIYLSAQSQQKIIPARHYRDYILRTETFQHEG